MNDVLIRHIVASINRLRGYAITFQMAIVLDIKNTILAVTHILIESDMIVLY